MSHKPVCRQTGEQRALRKEKQLCDLRVFVGKMLQVNTVGKFNSKKIQ